MIKFEVKHRYTGEVKFTAEIDCKESDANSIKLGLAIKWGIEKDADLSSADLRYADLSSADLSSADLRYADLSYADLRSANLRYADLRYANLRSADLSSANLRSADLSSANLRSADLSYADLRSADLSSADLSSANLRYADLSYADLSSADLRYAEHIIIPITINGLGEECRTGYAIWDNEGKEVFVRLGCFWGTQKEALAAISKKYGSKSGYYQVVKGACLIAKERKVLNPIEK